MREKMNENKEVGTEKDETLVGRIYNGDFENLKDDFEKIVAKKIANKIETYKERIANKGSFRTPEE